MGVTGLLQHLKEIQQPVSLATFRGKTLAVDTYGWLHRGLVSCAQELCQEQPTRKYVNSVIKKVDMLRHFGVEPYLVFDGAYLPTKAETARERRAKRMEAQHRAAQFLQRGDRKLAWKEFMKAAGVTPEMAKSIMVELDAKHVKYVVAPYEADPQMVYLEKIGAVDGILSEDSDLLVFGCRRLITKLTDFGECVVIDRADFSRVKKIPQLANYTPTQLRLVAMLAGCDYTKGVPGIGLKTAFTLVWKHGTLEGILAALASDGKVPESFADEVSKADLAFQFQKVFDPLQKTLCTLNEYPADLELDMEVVEACCGQTLLHELHYLICRGHLHPNTHEPLISREHNLSIKSNSMTMALTTKQEVEAKTSRPRSIEQYFSSTIVLSTPKKSVLMSAIQRISPTTKKIQRVMTSSSKPTRVSSFFLSNQASKPNHSVAFKAPPVRHGEQKEPHIQKEKEPMSESSLVDSDLPDEFSSPLKMKIAGPVDDVDTDEDKLTKPAAVDFDIDESDDDIKESPVKPNHLASVGKMLREHFVCGSESSLDKKTLLRRPLQALDHNQQAAKKAKISAPASDMTTRRTSPSSSKLERFAFTR